MKLLLKILVLGFAGLLVLGAVLVAFVFMRNLGDDALDPGAAGLLALSPPQIAAADNGYFAWIGVVGPESEPAYDWGRRWFEQALAADKQGAFGDDEAVTLAIDQEKRSESFTGKDLPCGRAESCLDDVAAAPATAREILAKAATTLERADSVLAFPDYQEAWRPDFGFRSQLAAHPPYLRQLASIRFALAVVDHRDDDALAQLGREMALHLRQTATAVTLVEEMIAVSRLDNDYRLLGSYLRRNPAFARQHAEQVAGLLAPIPAAALGLRGAMSTECLVGLRMFLTLKDEARRRKEKGRDTGPSGLPDGELNVLTSSLYLPNATANGHYRMYRAFLELDGKSGPEYRRMLAAIRRNYRDAENFSLADLVARNPVGHILLRIGTPDFARYYFRRDDLVALRAAVALQFDLLRRNIHDDESIRRAIVDARLVHPFTGEAPVWDASQHALTYQARPERRDQPLVLVMGN
jgi:hypothetical protein